MDTEREQKLIDMSQSSRENVLTRLSECDSRIAELQQQLAEQHQIKIALEKELTSLPGRTSSMDDFPEEVLVAIFSEIIRGDPLALGNILLVCRKWNSAAINAPPLWTDIVSNLRPNAESVNRITQYIQTAIKRSGVLPLKFTVRLVSPMSLCRDIAKKLYPQSPEDGPEHKAIVKWLRSIAEATYQKDPKDSHERIPIFHDLAEAIHNQIDVFTPNGGILDIHRLQSVVIHFNSNDIEYWPGRERRSLWDIDVAPERLSVLDITTQNNGDWFMPYGRYNPNLKYLSWRAAHSPESVIGDGDNLTHLRLYWVKSLGIACCWESNTPSSHSLRNVQQLFLHCDFSRPLSAEEFKKELVLPQLRDLALAGTIYRIVLDSLDAPLLSTLRLVNANSCSAVLQHGRRYPFIHTLHMDEAIFRTNGCTIDQLLDLFPSLTNLSILGESIESVRECILKLRAESKSLSINGYEYHNEYFWDFEPYERDDITC